MPKKLWIPLVAALLILVMTWISCGDDTEKGWPPKYNTPTVWDETQAGVITGVVEFFGTPPVRRKVPMASECSVHTRGGPIYDDNIRVKDLKVQGAFVYIVEGKPKEGPPTLGEWIFPPIEEAAVLDQSQCMYRPHILGVRLHQPVRFRSSDTQTHNVQTSPVKNPPWNFSLAGSGQGKTRRFTQDEIMVPVGCSMHGWMSAYIAVLDHPFFAVTGIDGSYRIDGVPPGEYTVGIWHEEVGGKLQVSQVTHTVTVKAKSEESVRFVLSPK